MESKLNNKEEDMNRAVIDEQEVREEELEMELPDATKDYADNDIAPKDSCKVEIQEAVERLNPDENSMESRG